MKKIFVVIFVMVTIFCACAQAETIMHNHLYETVNDAEFEVLNHLSDGEDYAIDGVYYHWATNMCMGEEMEGMTLSEIEEYAENLYQEHGFENVDVQAKIVGNDVIWIKINTTTDMTKISGANVEVEGPIYTANLVCWTDYEHMH